MNTSVVIERMGRLLSILETANDRHCLELLGNLSSAIRLLKKTEINRSEEWQFRQLESRIEQRILQLQSGQSEIRPDVAQGARDDGHAGEHAHKEHADTHEH